MSRIKYTPEKVQWLKEAMRTMMASQIVEEYTKLFHEDMTKDKLKKFRQMYGIETWLGKGVSHNRIFTLEMENWIRENVEGTYTWELTEELNKVFGTNITVDQLDSWKRKHKVRSGVDCRYKKGNVSRYCNPGETTVDKRGYVVIKTADRKWVPMARYVWEQAYGPIPDGMLVYHKDGDKQNNSLDNLYLIGRKELRYLNSTGMQKITTQENTETVVAALKLMIKTCERKKEANGHKRLESRG